MMKTIPEFEPFNKDRKLDIFGIINLSLMSAALMYGITKAADHASFNNSDTILWAGIGLVSATIYLVYNQIKKNQTVVAYEFVCKQKLLIIFDRVVLSECCHHGADVNTSAVFSKHSSFHGGRSDTRFNPSRSRNARDSSADRKND